ncbi:unnamed protein product [Lathyrus sativus]|nr:unnamed protein product [Lathyrus sativus]
MGLFRLSQFSLKIYFLHITLFSTLCFSGDPTVYEELLITWPGIQMRRDSWQDGVLGKNCSIPPKWNWTYGFQVKDQIGSFFYFPYTNFQRTSCGFGPFVINNRVIVPIPFV